MKHLPSLNGLRGISILLVVSSHLVYNNHISLFESDFRLVNMAFQTLYNGQLGVNVFFVVSGFIITRLLMHELGENGKISLKNFYIRRTLRIFPAYYFLLLVYLILHLAQFIQIKPESWLTAITYTKYFNHDIDWITGHAWTLSVEEHFYLLWPLALQNGNRFAKRMALFVVCIVPIIRIMHYEYAIDVFNRYTLFYRMDALAIGCLIALYEERIVGLLQPYWKLIFPISLIGIFLSNAGSGLLNNLSLNFVYIGFGSSYGTIANLLIALIILYSIHGPKRLWYRLLNLRVMVRIGIYSYSIYLWQQLFLEEKTNWINQFPQNIILVFVCAILSYHVIELPFLKLKSRFSR